MYKIKGYGWKQSKPDTRDLIWRNTNPALSSRFSLRNSPYMPSIYDQGQLGSCTANAFGSAYEFELKKQGEDFMPSRLWIYYQERVIEHTVNEDAGAEMRDGAKVVATGVCPETDWTYDISTFRGPPSAQAIKDATKSHAIQYFALAPSGPNHPLRSCLVGGYPFVFGFEVPASFESEAMASGSNPFLDLPQQNEQIVGGHAVKAVGYDFTCTRFKVPVFEVKNSWGADWGDQGYFYIHYKYFDRALATDMWTIRLTT